MQLNEYWFCSWETTQLLYEKNPTKLYKSLSQELSKCSTISFISFATHRFGGNTAVEFMIFLGKSDDNSEFEVRIYKASKYDKYVQNAQDHIKHYEDTEKYISFFFDKLSEACNFIFSIPKLHSEYKKRPLRKTDYYGGVTYEIDTIWN